MQYMNILSMFKCVYELTRIKSNYFSRLNRLNLDKITDIDWGIYCCHINELIEIHISDWAINFFPCVAELRRVTVSCVMCLFVSVRPFSVCNNTQIMPLGYRVTKDTCVNYLFPLSGSVVF